MYTKKNIGETGKLGEDYVCEYLRNKKYIVIKRNFSNRFGEIDIIAESEDYILFVEVKTRTEGALVSGLEAVNAGKINRILNLSNDFLKKFDTDKPPRFDVAEVTVDKDNIKLNYIESAF